MVYSNKALLDWEIQPAEYNLIVNWKISRSNNAKKKNYLVKINRKAFSEFAPNLYFSESDGKILADINKFKEISIKLQNQEDILNFCKKQRKQKIFSNCFIAGIEMACINYFGNFNHFIPETVSSCRSSISVPIMPIEEFLLYAEKVNIFEYDIIKIKSDSSLPKEIIDEILKNSNCSIGVDYNEAIISVRDAIEHHDYLSNLKRVEYIEQPFPASHVDHYREFKNFSDIPIILDENVCGDLITNDFTNFCDGINFKVMKSGGPLQTILQIKSARKQKLKCMLGCMVESSLSIASYVKMSGLVDYVDLDGSVLIENDSFNMIKVYKGEFFIKSCEGTK